MKKSLYISLQAFIVIASLFAFLQYTVVNIFPTPSLTNLSKKITRVEKESENSLSLQLKEWEKQSQRSASADEKVSPSFDQIQKFKDFYIQNYNGKEDSTWERWLQVSANLVGTVFPLVGFVISCWLWIQERKEKRLK